MYMPYRAQGGSCGSSKSRASEQWWSESLLSAVAVWGDRTGGAGSGAGGTTGDMRVALEADEKFRMATVTANGVSDTVIHASNLRNR
jgi:hypothetical protein